MKKVEITRQQPGEGKLGANWEEKSQGLVGPRAGLDTGSTIAPEVNSKVIVNSPG